MVSTTPEGATRLQQLQGMNIRLTDNWEYTAGDDKGRNAAEKAARHSLLLPLAEPIRRIGLRNGRRGS